MRALTPKDEINNIVRIGVGRNEVTAREGIDTAMQLLLQSVALCSRNEVTAREGIDT